MKNGPKLSLALIGIFLILCEFFYGIPFLGAAFILSFGWQPLLFNALLYLILTIILLVNRQNAIRPIAIIPIFGIVGSFFSYHPLLRNFDSLDFIFPNDPICPSCIISANLYT